MKIHKLLQNKDFGFIRLLPYSKEPMDLWKEKSYSYDDPLIENHEGNIGIVGSKGGLVLIDLDDYSEEDMLEIRNMLGTTLTVRTSSGKGYHLYYIIPEYKKGGRKFRSKHGGLEIRVGNMYVVVPGSQVKREDGSIGTYDVLAEFEPQIASVSDLEKVIGLFSKSQEVTHSKFDDWQIRKILARTKISDDIWSMINSDNEAGKESRSHRDQSIISSLLNHGLESIIFDVFDLFPCGDKMREKGVYSNQYLIHSIEKAKDLLGRENIEKMRKYNEIRLRIIGSSKFILQSEYKDIFASIAELPRDGNYTSAYQDTLLTLLAAEMGFKEKKIKSEFYSTQKIVLDRKSISIQDLLAKDFIEMKFWMNPLIPKSAIIIIGGKAGNFKSMLAMLFGFSMACNKPFSDMVTIDDVPRIIYYDLEMSENQEKIRSHYLINGLGFDTSKATFKFMNGFNKNNLDQELEEAKKYDVIILDSYRRFLTGNECDSETTNRLFNDFFKPLKDEGKTVIILHHLKKSNPDLVDEDLQDMFRGSTDIPAQMDLMFCVFKKKEEYKDGITDVVIEFAKAKNRDAHRIQNFMLKIRKDDFNMKTSIEVMHIGDSKEGLKSKVKAFIKDFCSSTLHKRSKIAEATIGEYGISDAYLTKILAEMISDGELSSPKNGQYISETVNLSSEGRTPGLDEFTAEKPKSRPFESDGAR